MIQIEKLEQKGNALEKTPHEYNETTEKKVLNGNFTNSSKKHDNKKNIDNTITAVLNTFEEHKYIDENKKLLFYII